MNTTGDGKNQEAVWGHHAGEVSALVSGDGRYQYDLTRDLNGASAPVHFVLLNPSPSTPARRRPDHAPVLGVRPRHVRRQPAPVEPLGLARHPPR